MPDEGGYAEISSVSTKDGNKFVPFDESLIPKKMLDKWCNEVYEEEIRYGCYEDI